MSSCFICKRVSFRSRTRIAIFVRLACHLVKVPFLFVGHQKIRSSSEKVFANLAGGGGGGVILVDTCTCTVYDAVQQTYHSKWFLMWCWLYCPCETTLLELTDIYCSCRIPSVARSKHIRELSRRLTIL